jgi:hypothetical protein
MLTSRKVFFTAAVLVMTCAACDQESPTASLPADTVVNSHLLLPWSEITGHIAVHVLTPSGQRIWFIDGVKREVVDLGFFGSWVSGMTLSPDGTKLAFDFAITNPDHVSKAAIRETSTELGAALFDGYPVRDHEGSNAVYLPDGKLSFWRGDTLLVDDTPVAIVPGYKFHPHSWTPDQSSIALSIKAVGDDAFSIFTRRIEHDAALQILIHGTQDSHWWEPLYSPQGQLLAVKHTTFIQMYYSVGDLWVFNSDGTGGRLLHSPAVSAYAWSPDARQLVVAGGSWIPIEQNPGPAWNGWFPMEQQGVFLVDATNGSFRQLMQGNANFVSWSK